MKRWKFLPLLIAPLFLLSSCVVFQPFSQSAEGLVYSSQADCVRVTGTIGVEDARRPWYMANARALYSFFTPWGQVDCWRQFGRPTGYIGASYQNFKWISPSNTWAICNSSAGWNYNTEDNIFSVFSGAIEPQLHYTPPCGPGTYYVSACGAELNGEWRVGCVHTPSIFISGQPT